MFADYKSVEYRLLAYYLHRIGYPQMAEEFTNGLDPHRQTAVRLLRKDDITDEERQFGKTMNFAAVYGAGPKHIGEMLWGVQDDTAKAHQQLLEARNVWGQFYAVNPGIRKLSYPKPRWPDPQWTPGALEQVLEQRGHIKTLWGRELHPEFAYRALNSLIQGCAADLMRAGMVKVHEQLQGFQSHLVLTIHDELIFDCTKDELPEVAKIAVREMSDDRIAEVLPVEVELEYSFTDWASKEEYHIGN